jgi:hypothetical protein
LYLNHQTLKDKKLSVADICKVAREVLIQNDGITDVVNLHELSVANLNDYQKTLYQNGNHAKRSGDIQMVTAPGWIGGTTPATHGSPHNYDTHIPFLMMGWGVKRGETFSRTAVADTAPTIAALLKILEPTGNVGRVIGDALKK